jgi:outer membrane protein assembly factor BamB
MKKILCAWAILLGLATATPAGDWSQFRGAGAGGVSEEKGLPTQWSTSEGQRWKVDLPGRGVSSPIVAGGRVYLTASSGIDGKRLHVLCFDVATGKKHWERQFWGTGNTACHPKTCMAAPTPVTDGERIYPLFATGDLACLDKDGNLIWYRSLVGDYPAITNQVGMAASPVLWKDVLIVPMDNVGDSFLAGLDKFTGGNRWKTERDRDINWVTPLVLDNGGQAEVVFPCDKQIVAYDPETGKQRWVYKGKDLASIPSPVIAKDVLLVPGKEVLALQVAPPKGEPVVAWKTNKLASGYVTPIYYEGKVYTVAGKQVICADPANGKVLWQERIDGDISASHVLGDGKLYVVNEAGTTFVIQLGDKPQTVATNQLNETILATPAVGDGALFLRSDQHLYCIGAKKK